MRFISGMLFAICTAAAMHSASQGLWGWFTVNLVAALCNLLVGVAPDREYY